MLTLIVPRSWQFQREKLFGLVAVCMAVMSSGLGLYVENKDTKFFRDLFPLVQ